MLNEISLEKYIKMNDDIQKMGLEYFTIDPSTAADYWNANIAELLDIIASMMNNGLEEGSALHETFANSNVLEFMKIAKFDYTKAKKRMKLFGDYIERRDYSLDNFETAIYNNKVITVSKDEFQIRARRVYNQIMEELETLGKYGIKFMKS